MANQPAVSYRVNPQESRRNRLTVAFRLILAIPHLLLVGGPGIGAGGFGERTGVFGVVAGVCAVLNWFAIVFTGKAVEGLVRLQQSYLHWRANALAYEALLRDEYPPFGEGAYPLMADFPAQITGRNRWTVGFRIFLVIPQAIVLAFLLVVWFVTVVIGWFAVLSSGRYPDVLWRFGEGVMRWSLRVETYILPLNDSYPPFSLRE